MQCLFSVYFVGFFQFFLIIMKWHIFMFGLQVYIFSALISSLVSTFLHQLLSPFWVPPNNLPLSGEHFFTYFLHYGIKYCSATVDFHIKHYHFFSTASSSRLNAFHSHNHCSLYSPLVSNFLLNTSSFSCSFFLSSLGGHYSTFIFLYILHMRNIILCWSPINSINTLQIPLHNSKYQDFIFSYCLVIFYYV